MRVKDIFENNIGLIIYKTIEVGAVDSLEVNNSEMSILTLEV